MIINGERSFEYYLFFFFYKQKTAYEVRFSDGSSDVCSSDLIIASCSMGCGRPGPMGSRSRRPRWSSGSSRTPASASHRSEENTSELQSLMRISYAVFCLKKNTNE